METPAGHDSPGLTCQDPQRTQPEAVEVVPTSPAIGSAAACTQATALCCNAPPLEAPECLSEVTHTSQRGGAREDVAQAAEDSDPADISARGEAPSITDENPQRAQPAVREEVASGCATDNTDVCIQATGMCCSDQLIDAPECLSEATPHSQREGVQQDVAQAVDDAVAMDSSAEQGSPIVTVETLERTEPEAPEAVQSSSAAASAATCTQATAVCCSDPSLEAQGQEGLPTAIPRSQREGIQVDDAQAVAVGSCTRRGAPSVTVEAPQRTDTQPEAPEEVPSSPNAANDASCIQATPQAQSQGPRGGVQEGVAQAVNDVVAVDNKGNEFAQKGSHLEATGALEESAAYLQREQYTETLTRSRKALYSKPSTPAESPAPAKSVAPPKQGSQLEVPTALKEAAAGPRQAQYTETLTRSRKVLYAKPSTPAESKTPEKVVEPSKPPTPDKLDLPPAPKRGRNRRKVSARVHDAKDSHPWDNSKDSTMHVSKAARKYLHPDWPVGTPVWAKLDGLCRWPGIVWSPDKVPKVVYGQPCIVMDKYVSGCVLVFFRGDHTYFWVKPNHLIRWSECDTEGLLFNWKEFCNKKRPSLRAFYEQGREEINSDGGPDIPTTLALLKSQEKVARFAPVPEESSASMAKEEYEALERKGLTPDWIIQAGCNVFQLEMPTLHEPRIKGLCDPCTNDLLDPNIPAERLYDKQLDGLILTNSWKGFYIILNPDFDAQIMWRFVNRAIDEVENGSVPAILLLCRNSTDTNYFQRLTPYPRCFLRQSSIRFKDYEANPIGFGIAIVCMASATADAPGIYKRFYDNFAPRGEVNVPVDNEFISSPEFTQLAVRLREATNKQARDQWACCTKCKQWRIVTFDELAAAQEDSNWTCSKVVEGCHVSPTKSERKWTGYTKRSVQEDHRSHLLDHWASTGSSGALPDSSEAALPACDQSAVPLDRLTGTGGGRVSAQPVALQQREYVARSCVLRYEMAQQQKAQKQRGVSKKQRLIPPEDAPNKDQEPLEEQPLTASSAHSQVASEVPAAPPPVILSSYELMRASKIKYNLLIMQRVMEQGSAGGSFAGGGEHEIDQCAVTSTVGDTSKAQRVLLETVDATSKQFEAAARCEREKRMEREAIESELEALVQKAKGKAEAAQREHEITVRTMEMARQYLHDATKAAGLI